MTENVPVFTDGLGGCAKYRIPTMITLPSGRILAFAEARWTGVADSGTICTALRISDDSGKTFSPVKFICRKGNDSTQNQCPVYDRDTGRVWLLLTWGSQDTTESERNQGKGYVYSGYIYSDDDGETWTDFAAFPDNLISCAFGPVHGIQLPDGKLMVPYYYMTKLDPSCGYYTKCSVRCSDDHGKTWYDGGQLENEPNGTECVVASLGGNEIYMNCRPHNAPAQDKYRTISYSHDGGKTWEENRSDPQLPCGHCQGTVLTYPHPIGSCKYPLIFVNAAIGWDPAKTGKDRRRMLTARLSLDGGKTWPKSLLLRRLRAAYADIAVLKDGSIGCLYEGGDYDASEWISFRTFTVDELLNSDYDAEKGE